VLQEQLRATLESFALELVYQPADGGIDVGLTMLDRDGFAEEAEVWEDWLALSADGEGSRMVGTSSWLAASSQRCLSAFVAPATAPASSSGRLQISLTNLSAPAFSNERR